MEGDDVRGDRSGVSSTRRLVIRLIIVVELRTHCEPHLSSPFHVLYLQTSLYTLNSCGDTPEHCGLVIS